MVREEEAKHLDRDLRNRPVTFRPLGPKRGETNSSLCHQMKKVKFAYNNSGGCYASAEPNCYRDVNNKRIVSRRKSLLVIGHQKGDDQKMNMRRQRFG